MRLNAAEKLLINNPVRRWVQQHYEIPKLLRMAHRLDGRRALEIGCGPGFGMELILEHFGAATVRGIDIDPGMVKRAQSRTSRYGDRADVSTGDASQILAADGSFDAVFDFGIIHHIVDWEKAVREVRRVLKPGGIFVFEEVSKQALDRWIYRRLFEHPDQNRFTIEDFVTALERHGLFVGDNLESFWFGDFFAGVGLAN